VTRPSLRQAIDNMCRGCIYDRGHGGTWREQVAECSSSNARFTPSGRCPPEPRNRINESRIALMPDWPARMGEDMAALYLGVSLTKFRERVDAKVYPQP
jgi:hypothetical protein